MTEIVNMETEIVNTITEIVNVETEIANTITNTNKNVFDFIKEPEKLQILIKVNELLHINNSRNKRLVFVYSAPKVGSTSIVSSLRIFGLEKIDIIHIHDEEMLEVLGHIKGITINELILFNKCNVFEIGPGTGYLGLLLRKARFNYSCFEITQSHFIYQAFIFIFTNFLAFLVFLYF